MFGKLFKKKHPTYYRSMWNSRGLITFDSVSDALTFSGNKKKKKDARIEKKPVEIFNEILSPLPDIDCSDLERKIKTIKERINLLKEHLGNDNPNDEYEALGYLEARKKLEKVKNLFLWPTTTEEKIQKLCSEYKVRVAKMQEFYTTLPEEAIDEMRKFTSACRKVRSDKPFFRLIVPDTEEMKRKKRDPILLGSSPFGRWDFILGAWDKEVAIVDEIIYQCK